MNTIEKQISELKFKIKLNKDLDNLTMVDLLKSRMLFLQLKRQNKLTIKK